MRKRVRKGRSENRRDILIEKELIIYTDNLQGFDIRRKLEHYGAKFLNRLGQREGAEYWKCIIPYDFNERLAKYDPELRMETSLAFYDLNWEIMNRLPEQFMRRRRIADSKVFYIEVGKNNKRKEVF